MYFGSRFGAVNARYYVRREYREKKPFYRVFAGKKKFASTSVAASGVVDRNRGISPRADNVFVARKQKEKTTFNVLN